MGLQFSLPVARSAVRVQPAITAVPRRSAQNGGLGGRAAAAAARAPRLIFCRRLAQRLLAALPGGVPESEVAPTTDLQHAPTRPTATRSIRFLPRPRPCGPPCPRRTGPIAELTLQFLEPTVPETPNSVPQTLLSPAWLHQACDAPDRPRHRAVGDAAVGDSPELRRVRRSPEGALNCTRHAGALRKPKMGSSPSQSTFRICSPSRCVARSNVGLSRRRHAPRKGVRCGGVAGCCTAGPLSLSPLRRRHGVARRPAHGRMDTVHSASSGRWTRRWEWARGHGLRRF